MKPAPFDYVRVDSGDGLASLLAQAGSEGRILAGGQALMAMLNIRLAQPQVLFDISRAADFEDKSRPAAHLTEPHAALVALLTRLRARVDFQDEDGFSAVVRSNPHATRTPTRSAAPRGSLLSSSLNVPAALVCACCLLAALASV